MLDSVHKSIRIAGEELGLSESDVAFLLVAEKEHVFEVAMDNGNRYKAYRVQHNSALGPYKGGIRFHPEVALDEVRALASLMSLKTAAVGLPLGGGKGGVTVDPRQLNESEVQELSRKYAAHMTPHIGPDKDVPAPDVNTNAKIIDWMVDEFEQLTGDKSKASFTGKSIEKGGSEGRTAATGRGGVIVLRELLNLMGRDSGLRIAVQGFGNVGSYFGMIAETEQPNWKLIAASDSSGSVFCESGVSAASLSEYKANKGRFCDYTSSGTTVITNDELLSLDCDVLILAALGDAITEKNVKSVKASIIVELANGPINDAAHTYLTDRSVHVVPDVLANAGGVIVSYLEWLQNKQGEKWTEDKVNEKLDQYLRKATTSAYEFATSHNVSLKHAAIALAVKRIMAARRT